MYLQTQQRLLKEGLIAFSYRIFVRKTITPSISHFSYGILVTVFVLLPK